MAAFAEVLSGIDETDPEESYFATGRAVLRFAVEHARLYALIFGAHRRDDRDTLRNAGEGTALHVLRRHIMRWQADGLLAQRDPAEISVILWAGVHGLAMLVCTGRLDATPEEVATYSDTVMRGLLDGLRQKPI